MCCLHLPPETLNVSWTFGKKMFMIIISIFWKMLFENLLDSFKENIKKTQFGIFKIAFLRDDYI